MVYPGDPLFDSARAVFNGMIDRHPLAVIRCAGASDVVRCIAFARRHDLPLSVRGGGHSVAGNAVRDDALMLDLSGMKAIQVDTRPRTVRAEPGLTLGEFDRATQAFGLATTLGVVSMTGIAGLTLGGGLGWLNGRYGLACDNLISADVATADGRLLRASARENEDLFWGIRGGGGNFGVVTSFEYQLHPVSRGLGRRPVVSHWVGRRESCVSTTTSSRRRRTSCPQPCRLALSPDWAAHRCPSGLLLPVRSTRASEVLQTVADVPVADR